MAQLRGPTPWVFGKYAATNDGSKLNPMVSKCRVKWS